MSNRARSAVALLVAVLAPDSALAALIGDVELTAFSSFSSQRVPKITDTDAKTAPPDELLQAAQTLIKEGLPFPNVPNSQNSGFASSAATVGGLFGVGVNGFHFENSLPPNDYVAAGTWTQTITNDSPMGVGTSVTFNIPHPTLQFFGVGNSFPAGADPGLDAAASVDIKLVSTLTHTDGSTEQTIHLDYGMQTIREPISGVLFVIPSPDASGLTRFDEPDGSFGFELPSIAVTDFSFGDIGPGESLEFGYEYRAEARTGFGETGVFAAIGDPFDLTLSGGSFSLEVVPEPGSLALIGLGLASLSAVRRGHVGT